MGTVSELVALGGTAGTRSGTAVVGSAGLGSAALLGMAVAAVSSAGDAPGAGGPRACQSPVLPGGNQILGIALGLDCLGDFRPACRSMVRRGVVRCGMVWCGVVWCGVGGVVWCGVV